MLDYQRLEFLLYRILYALYRMIELLFHLIVFFNVLPYPVHIIEPAN